jgi:hypothetical protein
MFMVVRGISYIPSFMLKTFSEDSKMRITASVVGGIAKMKQTSVGKK